MMHPDDPFALRSYRTSREAYGYSLYPEKRNRDYLWTIAGGILFVVAVVAVVWLHSG